MTLDPDRRSALLAAKLRALVAGRWDLPPDARAGSFPDGASLVDDASGRVWVLIGAETGAVRRLGAALAVALRAGARELHVLVDDETAVGVLARRAATFADPPTIWHVSGPDLEAVTAAPPATDPAPAPEAELYRPVLAKAGLEPVVEGGVLTGELLGLEVARVVADPDGAAHIEAGVGRFDREAGAMMFAELGETDAVARAVDIVARYRVAGAERHPLNQLVPERWLRAVVEAHPELVGAARLHAVGSALPRQNLLEPGIATALGVDTAGRDLVVTCATGADLDLVPGAADDRLTHAPDARLLLVLPEQDALPIIAELAALLADPADLVTVPADWRSIPGGVT